MYISRLIYGVDAISTQHSAQHWKKYKWIDIFALSFWASQNIWFLFYDLCLFFCGRFSFYASDSFFFAEYRFGSTAWSLFYLVGKEPGVREKWIRLFKIPVDFAGFMANIFIWMCFSFVSFRIFFAIDQSKDVSRSRRKYRFFFHFLFGKILFLKSSILFHPQFEWWMKSHKPISNTNILHIWTHRLFYSKFIHTFHPQNLKLCWLLTFLQVKKNLLP